MSDNSVNGQQGVATTVSEYNMLAFVFQMMLQKVQTVGLVKVISCTNNGAISPVGSVVVQPLVNQMTAQRQPIPHGELTMQYMRAQGGANAVILDPRPGDIGIALFCSRDISAVVSAKAQANPPSFRMFDWADGLYVGGVLNGAPSQYIVFNAAGIEIHSPTEIKLTAPTIDIEATSSLTINAPVNDIKGGGTKIDGKPFLPHTHTSESPGTPTGPVL